MGDLLQIVDAISASPTVLLDLNNEAPFGASQINFSPPPLRRASSSSMLADGSHVSASSYEDRVLEMTLELPTATQDLNAASLQTLARLLDRDGYWIKWQPTGLTHPVFFRAKRADMSTINDVIAAAAYRNLTLSIPAESSAFGLPETGTFTINNDPTNATNGCFAAFPTVKGDLATPLYAQVVVSANNPQVHDIASWARTSTLNLPHTSPGAPDIPGTWTSSIEADAGAIGGTTRRVTRASGDTVGTFPISFSTSGERRIFVRARASTIGPTIKLEGNDAPPVGLATAYVWCDLGVMRLPVGSPLRQASSVFGYSTPTVPSAAIELTVTITGAHYVEVDHAIAVPVDTGDRYMETSCRFESSAVATLVLDGVGDDEVWSVVTDVMAVDRATIWPFTGALPQVVPGYTNHIADISSLSKTATAVWTWTYYPRYLYVRGATT